MNSDTFFTIKVTLYHYVIQRFSWLHSSSSPFHDTFTVLDTLQQQVGWQILRAETYFTLLQWRVKSSALAVQHNGPCRGEPWNRSASCCLSGSTSQTLITQDKLMLREDGEGQGGKSLEVGLHKGNGGGSDKWQGGRERTKEAQS